MKQIWLEIAGKWRFTYIQDQLKRIQLLLKLNDNISGAETQQKYIRGNIEHWNAATEEEH